MILFLVVPLYLLINGYVIHLLLKWLHLCSDFFRNTVFTSLFLIVYLFLSLSLVLAFFLPSSEFQVFIKKLSNIWLGTFIYILLTLAVVDLGRFLLKSFHIVPKNSFGSMKVLLLTGTIVVLVVTSVSIYGVLHAKDSRITRYSVSIPKECAGQKQLKIALVADLHLGYSIGAADVERMARMINKEDVDLVCIAGDLIDNEFSSLDDPERIRKAFLSINSTYGMYGCFGNHDVTERLLGGFSMQSKEEDIRDPRLEVYLKSCGITMLLDESVLVNHSFYLLGRKDSQKAGDGTSNRLSPAQMTEGLDQKYPLIMMDHQPRQLEELAEAGVDLDLCGHTHDGQMFPGNLTEHLMWKNPCGYLRVGNMQNIVTSGFGLWGPAMRVGTNSEVCVITVDFSPLR